MEHRVDQVQRRAYGALWRTNLKLFCQSCRSCNEFHCGRLPKQSAMKPMFAESPTKFLHVDLTGPFVNSRDYVYVMTACYAFTRFVIVASLRNRTMFCVAKASVDHVILKFEVSQCILTNLGKEFQNEHWKDLC